MDSKTAVAGNSVQEPNYGVLNGDGIGMLYEACERGMGRPPTDEEWRVVLDWGNAAQIVSILWENLWDGATITGILDIAAEDTPTQEPAFDFEFLREAAAQEG